jgi:zinc and cadmium transporter
MSATGYLTFYCFAVFIVSLIGGYVPFIGKVTHTKLQYYLSASAGVMLGASFFHVMPDALALSGSYFGWWMSLGVVGLFCIERFIAPHSHEVDGGHHHGDDHHHEHKCVESEPGHGHDHAHEHEDGLSPAKDHRAAAPAVGGWMAVCGLTIHTFMNGVGLAGAVLKGLQDRESGMAAAIPGLAMFLAIVFHKPADALAISTVLLRNGVSRRVIALVQIAFPTVVAVGALAFYLSREMVEQSMEHQLTGFALSFSAGTFLFIALSDLLPEVQFHRHDRLWLFSALVAGVALMGGIATLEDLGGGHEHDAHGGEVKNDAHHHGAGANHNDSNHGDDREQAK